MLLLLIIVWSVVTARKAANLPNGPHTALIEVRGEIAADSEASAERLLSGVKTAFEDANAQAIVLRINSPGGSPVQAGIVYDELKRLKTPAQEEAVRRVRRGLRLGRVLHGGGRRRDLHRQGEHRGLDRRADGQLRLQCRDAEARRRAPAATPPARTRA
jgi:hypothetical protein